MDTPWRRERAWLVACMTITERFGGSWRQQLWDKFYPLERKYLCQLGAGWGFRADQIEDAIQDVFLEMMGVWDAYWLERGMEWLDLFGPRLHARLVDQIRRNDRHRAESLEALRQELRDGRVRERAFLVDTAEQREWLEARLRELGEKHKEYAALLRGHYLESRSYAELAAEAGCSVQAVKDRIKRALQALRRLVVRPPACARPRACRPRGRRNYFD